MDLSLGAMFSQGKHRNARRPPLMPAATIAPEILSDLIGAIYDCALDPSRWTGTLEAIDKACGFASAGLALNALPSGRVLLHTMAGIDEKWRPTANNYGADAIALWGGLERIQRFPLDEPIVYSSLEGLPPLRENRYFTEWLQPQGLVDAVIIGFARDQTMIGSVGFNRHVSADPIGEREVAAMRLLAPHFRRCIAISKLLDLTTIAGQTVDVLLNELSVGVVFVDQHLGIVHANAAAEVMLSSGDPILVRNGKLATLLHSETAALQAVVAQAAHEEHRLAHRGIGVPLRRKDGPPCVVHVLPLGRGDIRPGLRQRARAALFIASAQSPPQMPRDALAMIYDLTQAESRVFELIVEGKAPVEIASALGVAASTIRTHLLHVFDKTGCNRQSDLVKLAGSLSMPL